MATNQALMEGLLGGDEPREVESGLDPTLEENLCALLAREADDPDELVHRILYAESGDHVVIGGPNPPLYRHAGRLRRFKLPSAEVDATLDGVRDDEEIFVFGISLGEQVAALLRTRPNARITVWERDPWLVRLSLMRQDYSRSLESGRLTIALGVDLVDHLPHLHERRVVFHPNFKGIYADEMRLVSESISGETPAEGRRWIGLSMGGVVVSFLADTLRREGYSIFPMEVQRWDPRETETALRRLRPERVIAVNYDASITETCHQLDLPLTVWDVDTNTDRTPTPPRSKGELRVFTLHEKKVDQLHAAGFEDVGHLPLGINTDMRYPIQTSGELGSIPVAFVGSSLVEPATRFRRLFLQLYASFDCCGNEGFEETEARLESVLRAEREDYATYVTGALVEKEFGAFLEAALRSGTPEDPRKWVAEIVASQKRTSYISALADQGIHVWGDDGWKEIEAKCPGLTFHGVADTGKEVTEVYCSADINVDINRIYQPEAIPLRVFDVLACGGFLIAEHSKALESQFDVGKELVTYRTITELVDLVGHYREHPDEAAAMAKRGLEAVQARHTMRLRAAQLLGDRTGARQS